MSAIAEAHAWEKRASKLRSQAAREPNLDKRAELKHLADRYEQDARHAWRDAKHELRYEEMER